MGEKININPINNLFHRSLKITWLNVTFKIFVLLIFWHNVFPILVNVYFLVLLSENLLETYYQAVTYIFNWKMESLEIAMT